MPGPPASLTSSPTRPSARRLRYSSRRGSSYTLPDFSSFSSSFSAWAQIRRSSAAILKGRSAPIGGTLALAHPPRSAATSRTATERANGRRSLIAVGQLYHPAQILLGRALPAVLG